MASRKTDKLASLFASSAPHPSLPDPSTRVKRNYSDITTSNAVSSPSSTAHSFDLIMRDPKEALKSAKKSEKMVKSLDFLAPSRSMPHPHKASSVPVAGSQVCGYRVKSQTLSSEAIERALEDKELVQLVDLEAKIRKARRYWRANNYIVEDFVVVGVVCHIWNKPLVKQGGADSKASTSEPSVAISEAHLISSSNSDSFTRNLTNESLMVIRLSDLGRRSICVAVEPKLQSDLSIKFGDVLVVLNPSFENAIDGDGALLKIQKYRGAGRSINSGTLLSRTSLPSLKPDITEGTSVTTASKSVRPSTGDGAVCPVFVNRSLAEYCEFHMFEMFSETKNHRMVLNDAGGGALSKKAKHHEFVDTAKFLSEGVFDVCGMKWKVSERSVKIVSMSEQNASPTVEQMYAEMRWNL